MRILILGTGNVATVFCRLLNQNEINVTHIAGRNLEDAGKLAEKIGVTFSDFQYIPKVAFDLAILALSDDFLLNDIHLIPELSCPVVHTAGSVPMNVLKSIHPEYGVLYPLQSLRKEMETIPPIPFLIDANSESLYNIIHGLAAQLSAHVIRANDDTRKKLHLAAVWVSNFTNHMYTLAQDYCSKEQVAFELLQPLITETATRIAFKSPEKVQTGPAIRGDNRTMEKHLDMLKAYPELKSIYIKISESIINRHRS